ncbi:hypothetical protein [Litorivivens sp.]|uniref:hypothetical protein n=1 Tax=Litorivivens sp. TaxID=2020868 RepID=UPI00356AA3AF
MSGDAKRMMNIFKRLFNVLTLIPTGYAILLLLVMITGGVSRWTEFLLYNFGGVALGYILIAAANYIFFGKLTLWNKFPDKANS